MPLTVGVLKETLQSETRVALTPEITYSSVAILSL